MWRGTLRGLMIGALVLVAVGGRGYAAETTIKASAPIKGEGRFYKIGDNQLLFSGYFQGNVEAERDDLDQAGLVCPGLMEINRTTGTHQGKAGVSSRRRGRFPLCPLDLYRQTRECAGPFTVTGGTGKFSKAMGESKFALLSNVMEVVPTVPQRDVTGSFTGQAAWTALKYTMP